MFSSDFPRVVVLFSGKRKSGKDFITEKLYNSLGSEDCAILHISKPVKSQYADAHSLDLKELMTDSPYKEIHRKKMIDWSDQVRSEDPGYFCRFECQNTPLKKIWVVADIRRKTDIKWFMENCSNRVKTIRINASDVTRASRGYVFTSGVDDVTSECDLDDYSEWDLNVDNSDTDYKNTLQVIEVLIKNAC